MSSVKKSRTRQVRRQKKLLIMWAIFVPILVIVVLFFVKNKDEVLEDIGLKESHIYEKENNPDIEKLVNEYFTAYAACDQTKLKTLVVDPSKFDDMTLVQKKAAVVTGYNNIKCYMIKGQETDTMVVYVLANISIANVVSTPLDMNPALYVVDEDGKGRSGKMCRRG